MRGGEAGAAGFSSPGESRKTGGGEAPRHAHVSQATPRRGESHRVSTLLAPKGWLDLAKPTASHPALTDADGDCTRVGGEEVLFYNDAYFAKVRARYGVDKRCVETAEAFNWHRIKPSLGKGGDAMGFSADGRYIVKELGSDHGPLVRITRDYVRHVCGDSLLARFIFHFYHPLRKKNYVVMNCWTLEDPKGARELAGQYHGAVRPQRLRR